jgi:hypothetical protein
LGGLSVQWDGCQPELNSFEADSMGREAICTCDWAGEITEVKALLETSELIVRGHIRKRVPFSEIKGISVVGDYLSFTVGREAVQLYLGSSAAGKWAAAISSPPPSLARKLGITHTTVVRTIGDVRDESLRLALAEAEKISARGADLIVACVDTPADLRRALQQARAQLMKGVPIWMVYAKGPGHALDENAIRSLLRENGMIDTKVASVSAKYTALRFVYRKTE